MPRSSRRCGDASSRRCARRAGQRGAGVVARLRAWLSAPAPGRWALAGGVAALVLAAFVAGRFWPASPDGASRTAQCRRADRPVRSASACCSARSAITSIGPRRCSWSWPARRRGERVSIAAEQRRAGDLLAATRLYRRAAVEAGDADVADVLESLQRILVEVTGSPSELSAFELQALQNRIEKQGLLFKLRIASSAVRNREQSHAPGGTTRPSPAPDTDRTQRS